MPETIAIGGLSLSGTVLAAVLSALAGWAAVKLWAARAREARRGPWEELMLGAALIAALCWKFGIVWRDPSMLWEQPRLLLVVTGTEVEAAVGIAAAFVYWLVRAYRRGIRLLRALDGAAVAAAGVLLAWNALSAPEYRWGYAVLCAVLLAMLLRRPAEEREGAAAVLFGYGLGAGGLTVSLFAPLPPWSVPIDGAGLTGRQWLLLFAGIGGALIDWLRERTG